jgi:hypothetical protein
MGEPLAPPVLDDFGDRLFSFYPPILNVEHNEWKFRQARWSEILVENPRSGIEVWIPRSFLGDLAKVDEPVIIVGLKRELEYKGGSVIPYARRVIPMGGSSALRVAAPGTEAAAPAPPNTLRLDASETKIGRLIAGVLIIGILACFLVVLLLRRKTTGGDVEYQGVLQTDLGLSYESNYFDIVRKLGEPAQDRYKSDVGERQYRALTYTDNDLTLILMGADRKDMHYIGAKDGKWRTVHTVKMPGGEPTDAVLRTLPKF